MTDIDPGEHALDQISFADWQAEQRELNHKDTTPEDPLDGCGGAEAIKALLTLLMPTRLKGSTPAVLGHKLLAICTLLQVGPCAGLALSDVADKVGCTRALLSCYGVQFSTGLGIHFRQQKRETSRETFRAARLAVVHAGFETRRAERTAQARESKARRVASESGE